MKLAMEGYSNI